MNEHTHRVVSVYVGPDVHKDSIDIAVVEAARAGECATSARSRVNCSR
jgi:hypothetical protein